jgi:prephenate dehydrogenase
VILLATPVRTILANLEELPGLVPGPALVIDLGSTKREILKKMDALPARFEPVGGHPMCGKEKGSFMNAEAAIYRDAPFALVSLSRTTPGAKLLAEEIALRVGSLPLWIDAQTHDRWVAATSHTPFLLASALSRATPAEAGPLVGPGFRSTARLAVSPAMMMVDILATNSDNIKDMLAQVQAYLADFQLFLEHQEYQRLVEALALGAEQYRDLVKEREP